MSKDSLGDRMRHNYEDRFRFSLPRRTPAVLRVDGKAFHTFTRGCEKPFDTRLGDAMIAAAKAVAEEMQGFKLAYVQSDEASFLVTDFDQLQTQAWFDYNKSKMESITASCMTAHFNIQYGGKRLLLIPPELAGHEDTVEALLKYRDQEIIVAKPESACAGIESVTVGCALAMFDARAFSVPREEVANYFLWRAKDWERNSIQMYCQAHFSPKEMHGKVKADQHEMLHGIGKNWTTDLPERWRNGAWIFRTPDGLAVRHDIQPRFPEIDALVGAVLVPAAEPAAAAV